MKPQTEVEKRSTHPQVIEKDILKHSGKQVNLVNAPIVSVEPSSKTLDKDHGKAEEPKIIDDLSLLLNNNEQEDYPYSKLKIGQGFFLPTQPNSTTDKLKAEIHRSVNSAKQRFGEVEVTEDGDEILDMICVQERKHNEDGTIQLDGDNQPIVGANFQQVPKYIYARNFIVKTVVKNDKYNESEKANADGVMVIRVA